MGAYYQTTWIAFVILFRYLCKELYANLLAITLVLLIIFITNQFVHYLKDAASGQITMTAVMQIMSLQIPLLLGYLLPLGLYLSILIGYGRLYVDHEMTVLFSCGMSRAQLMGMTMLIAFFVMIVVGTLMLWVEPIIQGYRTAILDKAITKASMQKIVPKRFQTLGKGTVFYVDSLSREQQDMFNIFLAHQHGEKKNQWDVTVAKKASERKIPDLKGQFIVFHQGYRYIGEPGQRDFRKIKFDTYGVKLVTSAASLTDWPSNVPTKALWDYTKNDLSPDKYRQVKAMLQWRIAMPISVILFALLAFPLSQVNPRSGKFAQLFPAILIYIAYADLLFLGRAWIEKGTISPTLGLWWIHGAAFLLAILLNAYRYVKSNI